MFIINKQRVWERVPPNIFPHRWVRLACHDDFPPFHTFFLHFAPRRHRDEQINERKMRSRREKGKIKRIFLWFSNPQHTRSNFTIEKAFDIDWKAWKGFWNIHNFTDKWRIIKNHGKECGWRERVEKKLSALPRIDVVGRCKKSYWNFLFCQLQLLKGALVARWTFTEKFEYVSITNFHSLNLKIVWYRNRKKERWVEKIVCGVNSIAKILIQ